MAAPAGYTELGRVGFVDKGTYASGTTYRIGDVVYYNGSTWSALKDNLKGVTPVAGANWKYMARGFASEALSAVTAKDTSGVLGTAGASVTSQALVDAIADKVMTKLIEKSKIVNNLLATDTTTVLSGPMGKSLDEKIGGVISDLGETNSRLSTAIAVQANIDISQYRNTSIVSTASMCILCKQLNIVVITLGSVELKYLGEGGTKTIFTLPAAYKPKTKTAFILRGSDGKIYKGFVANDTIIQIDNLPSTDLFVAGQLIYLV